MHTTAEFLDLLKERHGLKSDYAVAKFMGWSTSQISNYRHRGSFNDTVALDVAESLKLPAGYVLACVAAERTRDPLLKSAWERVAERLKGVAAALLVGFVVVLGAGALPSDTPSVALAAAAPLYIMSNIEYFGFHFVALIILALSSFLLIMPARWPGDNNNETGIFPHA